MNRYIFTGAPGSGKHSVLQALEAKGYTVVKEAAAELIKEAQLNGIKEPWQDPAFIEKIALLQKQKRLETLGKLQFYDRSPFCTLIFSRFLSPLYKKDFTSFVLCKEIDYCLKKAIYRRKVFFFERTELDKSKDIYKISDGNALIFEGISLRIYENIGFDLCVVPRGTIEEQCEFILKNI